MKAVGSAESAASLRLRLLTYNIHRAIGVDRRFRVDRIAEIIARLDPDVALLQEVDEGVPRSKELDLAAELAELLKFPHRAVGYNVYLYRGRYGNATLSRYPILAERNIDLSIESRKRRGCLHTRVEAMKASGHPHPLDIFNVHLGLSAQERARQIGILARAPEFHDPSSDETTVVAGDFNDWRSLLHPTLTDVMRFECATQTREGFNGALRTYPSLSPRGGIDRVYYRGALRATTARTCRLAISRVASDHLPVVVDFELR